MPMPRSWVGILLLIIGGAAAPAAAQDQRRTGIVLGYPPGVSVLLHATDRLAVRPELTFSFTSTEIPTSEGGTSETSSTSVGVGASALFYLSNRDHLRTYVSPRFAHTHGRRRGVEIDRMGHPHRSGGGSVFLRATCPPER